MFFFVRLEILCRSFEKHLLCHLEIQGCQDSKLQAERIAALQERKQALEALLKSRVGELKQVCLQEAVSSPQITTKTLSAVVTFGCKCNFVHLLSFYCRACNMLATFFHVPQIKILR